MFYPLGTFYEEGTLEIHILTEKSDYFEKKFKFFW